ncbi:MAG TPA: response regulator [Mucilaginibacter sp.]|jgi:two-component system response regulator VicR|nr:response regulator [Mucilaginibacter sp.]
MPKRILVIDDDPDILEILDIIFQQEGYEVVLSETGNEAEPDQIMGINPDLILLDLEIKSSNKDGAVICAILKSQPETKKLPIVLLSSKSDVGKICGECGADDYLRKPFDIIQLSTKIRQHLAA